MDTTEAIHTTIHAGELLALLAAPKAFAARAPDAKGDLSDRLRESLTAYAALLRQLPVCDENTRAKSALPAIEQLLADLPPVIGAAASQRLIEAARAVIAQSGWPAPEEGWDEYDPPPTGP